MPRFLEAIGGMVFLKQREGFQHVTDARFYLFFAHAFWGVRFSKVRQMERRCEDADKYPELWAYCHAGQPRALAYPNVFITIAPAEWVFPIHFPLFHAWKKPADCPTHPRNLSDLQGPLTLHIYNVLMAVVTQLLSADEFFEKVWEHVIRVEFQGRGTLHIHIALWAMVRSAVDLRGRTGQSHNSPLIHFLESIGFQRVDVQYGEGFLNYINGYTAKCSDSLDFRLNEHVRQGENSKWRMAYRMLCKYSPCIPEVFCHFASLPLMKRSFQIDVVFAPIQRVDTDMDSNNSLLLYKAYLDSHQLGGCSFYEVHAAFLDWCRVWRLEGKRLVQRAARKTIAIGVRFCFELQDNFLGQFAAMFLPHSRKDEFLAPAEAAVMPYTKFFVGVMHYFEGLKWCFNHEEQRLCVVGRCGGVYRREAFPRPLPLPPGDLLSELDGKPVFAGDRLHRSIFSRSSFDFWACSLEPELRNRVSKGRAETFQHRFRAVAALYGYFAACDQSVKEKWSRTPQKNLEERAWPPQQEAALAAIREGVNVVDANQLQSANRFLFLRGQPGSGKSEVLVHAAVNAAAAGCHVLVLCPTGTLVHSYRDKLPESERIVVETIHSGFQICRTQDAVVQYSPPSRLRRYDLLLLDEASQVEDHVSKLLFLAIQELPQKPFVAVAADFQQLNPIQGGGLMQKLCQSFPSIELCSVFRTKDPVLLAFLQSIRCHQPSRAAVRSFFQDRILSGSLTDAVQFGLRLSQSQSSMFSWLCVTNHGADKVNCTALALLGVTEAQVAAGFPGDPKVGASKIYIKPNLYIRLTRNLDKDRGFVNGAIGIVQQIVAPGVFTLLLTSGALVLVHPVSDGTTLFLPCAYGYATTIRRAQGSSLQMGCIFFDHCYPPERGYGYVAASRFRHSSGVFLFGKVRRTDWLPVNGDPAQEQVHRSADSEDSDFDDQDADMESLYDGSVAEDDFDQELAEVEQAGLTDPSDIIIADESDNNLSSHTDSSQHSSGSESCFPGDDEFDHVDVFGAVGPDHGEQVEKEAILQFRDG